MIRPDGGLAPDSPRATASCLLPNLPGYIRTGQALVTLSVHMAPAQAPSRRGLQSWGLSALPNSSDGGHESGPAAGKRPGKPELLGQDSAKYPCLWGVCSTGKEAGVKTHLATSHTSLLPQPLGLLPLGTSCYPRPPARFRVLASLQEAILPSPSPTWNALPSEATHVALPPNLTITLRPLPPAPFPLEPVPPSDMPFVYLCCSPPVTLPPETDLFTVVFSAPRTVSGS